MAAIREAGYDGVQFHISPEPQDLEEALKQGLGVCAAARVKVPEDAVRVAQEAHLMGLECLTLHVGWGLEDDDQAVRLIEAVLNASAKHAVPMYVETHRATLFQDMWRAVSFHRRFPALEFNGDFSHWYTGQEMVYGGFETKFAFIKPLLECVRFMHGRIGNPGSIQVDLGSGDPAEHPYIDHFKALWTHVFARYLQAETVKQEFFTFTPELLAPDIYYARTFHGKEESDRWQQSLLLRTIAQQCFAEAAKSAK